MRSVQEETQRGEEHAHCANASNSRSLCRNRPKRDQEGYDQLCYSQHARECLGREEVIRPAHGEAGAYQRLETFGLNVCELHECKPQDDEDQTVPNRNFSNTRRQGFDVLCGLFLVGHHQNASFLNA